MKPTWLRSSASWMGSLIYGGPQRDGHVDLFPEGPRGGSGDVAPLDCPRESGGRRPEGSTGGLVGSGHRRRQSRTLGGGETAAASLPRRYSAHVIVTPDVGGRGTWLGVARVGRVPAFSWFGRPRSPGLPLTLSSLSRLRGHLFSFPFKRNHSWAKQ